MLVDAGENCLLWSRQFNINNVMEVKAGKGVGRKRRKGLQIEEDKEGQREGRR